jgi:hypothetical protein
MREGGGRGRRAGTIGGGARGRERSFFPFSLHLSLGFFFSLEEVSGREGDEISLGEKKFAEAKKFAVLSSPVWQYV